MLLSRKHNFIFLKTKKTGGSSLEMCFSQHMRDRHDIITPLTSDEEEVRATYKIRAKNYAKPGKDKNTLNYRETQFWHHMSASQIKEQLPADVWDKCLKITAERHPYEKALSLAWYNFPRQDRFSTFSMWLDDVVEVGFYENWSIYSIDGKNIADMVIRFEHLLEDTNKTLRLLKLPAVEKLPLAKTFYRKDPRTAEEILTAHHKKRIQEVCAKEFEYFGYAY
jgi:hypothetical protein